jgi:hypothetical protein
LPTIGVKPWSDCLTTSQACWRPPGTRNASNNFNLIRSAVLFFGTQYLAKMIKINS